MTRRGLLPLGLGVLGLSLLVQVVVVALQGDVSGGSLDLLQLLGWAGSATLFVGSGLTVAGVVLRVLDGPALPGPVDHDGS